MHVHVLFDAKGKVHALFHPSTEKDAPQLEFRPARGQRTALLEVPAGLEKLEPRELHAAVSVKVQKDGMRLIRREPPRPRRKK
jgi:hypothetical protein